MISIINADVSLLALVISVVVSTIIGMLWFGPLFGKTWLKLINKKMEELESKPIDYFYTLVRAITLALVISLLASYTIQSGFNEIVGSLMAGFLGWLGFIVTSSANYVIWEGKSFKLYLFNMTHLLVEALSIALVVGLVR